MLFSQYAPVLDVRGDFMVELYQRREKWKIKRYCLIILTKLIQLRWESTELEKTKNRYSRCCRVLQ